MKYSVTILTFYVYFLLQCQMIFFITFIHMCIQCLGHFSQFTLINLHNEPTAQYLHMHISGMNIDLSAITCK
jgi:hypothetical protein